MPDVVDLRSDTVTQPSEDMRAAMAAAEVGDDVLGDDPTVNLLQDEAAARFGREAALFCPSGVMANQLALRTFAQPGTEVIIEADAHIVNYEDGAGAVLGGVQFRTLPSEDGRPDVDGIEAAIRPDDFHLTPTSLIALENSHNRKGGTVVPLRTHEAVADLAHRHGVRVYLDGARLMNAAVATGTEPVQYGRLVDGLMISLSKGLGAPVGSLLVGDTEDIDVARRWRRRYGGAMRQAGVIAAAGLHALRHNVDRLADDHANARLIADIVAAEASGAVDPTDVETNIVYLDTGRVDAGGLADELATDGILVIPFDPSTVRIVTHLDVDEPGCRRAGEAIARALS